MLAFRDADGSIAIVAHNPLADAMPINLLLGTRSIRATLPADSFASVRLPAGLVAGSAA